MTISLVDAVLFLGVLYLTYLSTRAAGAYIKSGGLRELPQQVVDSLASDARARSRITVSELGDIERDLVDLRETIIVAHRIEKPEKHLRAAVEDNFQQGVRYVFVVSESELQNAATNEKIFHAIFTFAQETAPLEGPNSKIRSRTFEELFAIRALRGEWQSWPYIFYRCGSPTNTIAFRGDQLREGIAENYVQLSGADAASIFCACEMAMTSEARSDVGAGGGEFSDRPPVLSIVSSKSITSVRGGGVDKQD